MFAYCIKTFMLNCFSISQSFEAGIANTISSFKCRDVIIWST